MVMRNYLLVLSVNFLKYYIISALLEKLYESEFGSRGGIVSSSALNSQIIAFCFKYFTY